MEKLREWLDLTTISVSELAEEIGVTRQTVHNWLAENSYPSGLALRRLHERTRIPLEDLVPKDAA